MTTTTSPAVIRQWARDNGIAVGDHGRLSPEVLAAFTSRVGAVGAAEARLDADPEDGREVPASGRLQLSVRPTPGATGIGRRVRARTS